MKSTANTTASTRTSAPAPVSAHAWRFAPDAISVDGRTFAAKYSIAVGGDVYVFAQVGEVPVRIHVGAGMPE